MDVTHFAYPPSPEILQWLSAGQFASRLPRSLRLWVLLSKLYGGASPWATQLPQPFSYPDVRDRLFAPTHGKSDTLSAEQLVEGCRHRSCICHQTLTELVFAPHTQQSLPVWQQQVMQLTGLDATEVDRQLQLCPFATVHRSIRDDLKQLAALGWLDRSPKGKYKCRSPEEWPSVPVSPDYPTALYGTESESIASLFTNVSLLQQLLPVLESIAFVEPNLELVIQSFWEQLAAASSRVPSREPLEIPQRIFVHLDYILPPEEQDRVDTYQEQLEQLWRKPEGGVVQFEYWLREGEKVTIATYPVCLHYARRAKYLSAYGIDPNRAIAWHNYRLDRIASSRLTVLAWGDPQVPKRLKILRRTGELPTPDTVRQQLDAAWGFNFYLPRELSILRFSAEFARWYVEGTVRHPTFKAIAYSDLAAVIRSAVADKAQQREILSILQQRSPSDVYYKAWIRTGDINIIMRLRDWRPNCEVIAPLSIRRQMMREMEEERFQYKV